MAIRQRGRVIASVRYALVYEGKTLDRYDFTESEGKIADLIGKCDRNPGMRIVAEVVHAPDSETGAERVSIQSVVYPAV